MSQECGSRRFRHNAVGIGITCSCLLVLLLTVETLCSPLDERFRKNVSMACVFDLEDLESGRLLSLANPPDAIFGDNALQPYTTVSCCNTEAPGVAHIQENWKRN